MLIAFIAALAAAPVHPPAAQAGSERRTADAPAIADAGVYAYRVRKGDTLSGLARDYMRSMADYREVQALNAVADPYHLQPGSTLRIPRRLLRAILLEARIVSFQGGVTLDGGRQGQIGTKLREGARIATDAGGSVTFMLADKSRITLPSLSVIRIARLRRLLISGQVERNFMLDAGRSDASVTPSRQGRDRFEIRTPVSVAAVRGTQFRVAVTEEGHAATASVLKGDVGVAAGGGETDVPAAYGVRSDATSAGKAVALLPPPEFDPPVHIEKDGSQVFTLEGSSAAARYRLQIANDYDFNDIRGEYTQDKPVFHVPALPPGTYSVRASAIDKDNIEGLPTEIFSYVYMDHSGGGKGKGGAATAPTP